MTTAISVTTNKPVTFSAEIRAGIDIYRENITALSNRQKEINAAKGTWEVQAKNLKKGIFPSKDELEKMVDTGLEQYLSFQKTEEKANETYNRLKNTIVFCLRSPIIEQDCITLQRSGHNVEYIQQNERLKNQIIPHLNNLLDRIDTLRSYISHAVFEAGCPLNKFLYRANGHLGKVGWGDIFNNAVFHNVILNQMIDERKEKQKNHPIIATEVNRETTISQERVNPKTEVQKLQVLLEEVKELTAHFSLLDELSVEVSTLTSSKRTYADALKGNT